MREALVEANLHRHSRRMRRGETRQRALVSGLTGPKKQKRGVHGGQLLRPADDEVQSLLRDKTRHHSNDRTTERVVSHRQSEAGEQRALALTLAAEIARIEMGRQKRIGRRIPEIRVNSVQDAQVAPAESAKNAVHTGSRLLCPRLFGIRGTDRRDVIRTGESRFEKTELAPELSRIHCEDRPR